MVCGDPSLVIDTALVINGTINTKEVNKCLWLIAWLATMIACLLRVSVTVIIDGIPFTRFVVVEVIVAVSAISRVAFAVIASGIAAFSGGAVSSVIVVPAAVVCVGTVVCVLKALSPSVISIWVNWTWIGCFQSSSLGLLLWIVSLLLSSFIVGVAITILLLLIA